MPSGVRTGGRILVMEADRSCRFEEVALHAYFRTYIAGQSLDLDDARVLWQSLPPDEVDGPRRIPDTPTLIMCGTKR